MKDTLNHLWEITGHVMVLQDIINSDRNIRTVDVGHVNTNGIFISCEAFNELFPDQEDYDVITEGYEKCECHLTELNGIEVYALFNKEKEVD